MKTNVIGAREPDPGNILHVILCNLPNSESWCDLALMPLPITHLRDHGSSSRRLTQFGRSLAVCGMVCRV